MRTLQFHTINIISGFSFVYFTIQAIIAEINYIALPLLLISLFFYCVNNKIVE